MRRIIRLLSLCTAAAWLVLCLPCIALASGYDGESVLLLATDKLLHPKRSRHEVP